MVPPKEYFFYLKNAFKKNHVHGYMIGKKANRKICIYLENRKWIVAQFRNGVPCSVVEYKYNDIWHACEDMIARLAKDEKHRKKIWMDWADSTYWSEKMSEPIVFHLVKDNEEQNNERVD